MDHELRSIQTGDTRRYELLVEIGTGGMGKVHLARAVGMAGFERIVAIKHCHPHLIADEEFVAMFLDEARLAARIHHPNVVPTLDVGQSDVLYLVMEYVEGDTLSRLIREAKRANVAIPVDVALRIAIDALAGLQAAHELRDAQGGFLGVVHRDVTPQNIIVGIDGVARILDFGIATAASRSTTTKEGHIKGKLGYMAPEQLGGEEASPGTDVYALGVVLWEALTLTHLFRGKNEADTMAAVLRGDVPSLRAQRPEVPPELETILRHAIARDPDHRYSSAAQFSEALETARIPVASARAVGAFVQSLAGPMLEERRQLLREASQRVATAPGPEAMPATVTPKSRMGPWALAAAAVFLVGGALWYFMADTEPPPPQAAAAVTREPAPVRATPAPSVTPEAAKPVASIADAGAVAKPDASVTGEPPASSRRKARHTRKTKAREWFPARP